MAKTEPKPEAKDQPQPVAKMEPQAESLTLLMPKRALIVLASFLKPATLLKAVSDEHILSDEAFHRIEEDQGV